LEEVVKGLGYNIRTPGQAKGRSGVLHSFTMCARRGEQREIAIEVDNLGRPAEVSILAFYAKALDADLKGLILIMDAPLSVEARHLARQYDMHILPRRTPAEKLKQQVKDILSSKS